MIFLNITTIRDISYDKITKFYMKSKLSIIKLVHLNDIHNFGGKR